MKDVPMNERTWSTGLLLVTLTLVTCFMSWGVGSATAAGLEKDHATLLRARYAEPVSYTHLTLPTSDLV